MFVHCVRSNIIVRILRGVIIAFWNFQICANQENLFELGPSINGLVTDGNTKLCCRGFILALFQSRTADKIDSEHTRGNKRLLPVSEAEILRVTLRRIEVFTIFYVVF